MERERGWNRPKSIDDVNKGGYKRTKENVGDNMTNGTLKFQRKTS